MVRLVSKALFNRRVLSYLREVQLTGNSIVFTSRGIPVLKLVPFTAEQSSVSERLLGSVIKYVNPTDPVAVADWDALR